MVTATFAVIDPATATFTYAVAGHPAPVLALADGSVQVLPGDGLPLGIAPSVDAQDWTFTMPPGSLLVLYTDGLIEFDRDVIAGQARMIEAMSEEVATPNPAAARSLVGRVFENAKNTDDVAVLSISIAERIDREFAFTFSAIAAAVPLVRRAYTRYLRALPIGEDDRFAVITAAGEAIANAVEHAYADDRGNVSVHMRFADGVLDVSIEDEGLWRTTTACEERGRGFVMMRALMTEVEIDHRPRGTTVRLRLRPAPIRGR
jgi:anti-sigma regulatory factor (Ser/Thr protein kinase)